jgi:hypothetical protein
MHHAPFDKRKLSLIPNLITLLKRHAMRKSIVFFLVLLLSPAAWGWDFSKHSVPIEDIVSGGPPRDGIPALNDPKFVKAGKADYMRDDEQVLGVNMNGSARAYPIRILSWHELVNDQFGDQPVLISW